MKNIDSGFQTITHRVGQNTAEVWIGSLRESAPKQKKHLLKLIDEAGVCEQRNIVTWKPAFAASAQGFYSVETFEALKPASTYRVELYCDNVLLAESLFKTLPESLPGMDGKAFTIALGSCYSNQDDNGQFGRAFTKILESEDFSPDICFLVGDQVYVDLGFQSLIPVPALMRRRMRKIYQKNWHDLAPALNKTAVWMLPDDHEFWNDYPFNNLPILALQSLKLPFYRKAWIESANHAVDHIQQSRCVEIVNIGEDLSICLADTRRGRHQNGFMSEASFNELIAWVKGLKTLGVLVIQQLLIDELGGGERNLLSFTEQYSALVRALVESGQNILVLTGDVHYGRVASVKLDSGASLIEVAASPLSNLKGVFNGLGADVAEAKPSSFPPIPVEGVEPKLVEYDSRWYVPAIKGKDFTQYPKDRTKEHFATLSFKKDVAGTIELKINGWLVRELGQDGQLISAFDSAKVYKLCKKM